MIPKKRKSYFVEKRFQLKYMSLTVLMLLVYSCLFVVVLFAPHIVKLNFNYSPGVQAEAAQMLLLLDGTVWPWIGAVILLFGIVSIYISHMVAGPLYHLKKSLSKVTQGNLEEVVKLRKWDDLKDVADHVNLLTEELRVYVSTLRNDYDLLSDYIAELEHKMEMKMLSEESGREIIGKIQASRNSIEIALKKFNIQN